MKLTDSTIYTVKPKKTAQKLSDGGGLFLHVLPNGSKHWRMALPLWRQTKAAQLRAVPAGFVTRSTGQTR